jgi:hypothetical protein
MADAKHSAIRMQQRGISRQKVDLIIECGVQVPVAGGAHLCMVPRRQINDEIQHLHRQIRRWESLKDTAIVVGENGDLITVQHHICRHRTP